MASLFPPVPPVPTCVRQVEICLGIMAGAGGRVAHWALTATDVLHVASELDVVELVEGIPKLVRARRMLKTHAPRVYDVLFSKFVDQLLENIGNSLASAATAHFVGRALGRMGRHKPGQLMKTIKDIAGWAAAFVAIRLVAITGLAAKDLKKLALDMKSELSKMNIQVSVADAEAMVREMSTHKTDMLSAMQLMQGTEPKTSSTGSEPPRRERIWKGTRF